MAIQVREIVENFPDLINLVRGDLNREIEGISDPSTARRNDLIFASKPDHLDSALSSNSQIWLIHTDLIHRIPATAPVVLSSKHIPLCMSRISQKFFPITKHHQPVAGEAISPKAVISPKARIGSGCIIGPGAVIGDECEIGDRTRIGANAVIEPGVKIGADCQIHPLVFIGHSCQIGDRCEIHPNTTIGSEGFGYAQDEGFNHHRIIHYGRVVIEDDVHIGANVQIDRGTFLDSRIGSGTKIDNHCHFGHNIQIGRNTVITGGVIAAGSVKIGSYCVIGGRTTIAGHLEIGDRVQLAGLSGVSKSVLKPGQYGGFPLQDLASEMRARAAYKKLPEVLKQLRRFLGAGDEVNR